MMAARESTSSWLAVRRVRAECLLPAALDDHRKVEQTVVKSIVRQLSQWLGQLVSQLADERDPSVWRIRRLHAPVDLRSDADGDAAARAIALNISKRLARVFAEGADLDNVRHFRNWAHYLGEYLVDRASGGGNRWYFGSFEGLSMLPASAALRTAITREPATGLLALREMAVAQQRQVVAALTPGDARRVLDEIVVGPSTVSAAACVDGVVAVWTDAAMVAGGQDESCLALNLYVAACRASAPPGPELRAAAQSIVALAERLTQLRSNVEARRSDPEALISIVASLGAVATPLLKLTRQRLREIADRIVARGGDQSRNVSVGVQATRFGFALILLPFVDQLPLEQATASWPDCGTMAAATIVRFLLLLKCCGGDRLVAFADPLLRELLRIGPRFDLDALREWDGQISAAMLEDFGSATESIGPTVEIAAQDMDYLELTAAFVVSAELDRALSYCAAGILRAFASRLSGFAGSHFAYLWTNFLVVGATIEDGLTCRVVRIGQPPLALVLNMSGLGRARYRLSWLDDRVFELVGCGD
jgi:hypothetical protein